MTDFIAKGVKPTKKQEKRVSELLALVLLMREQF